MAERISRAYARTVAIGVAAVAVAAGVTYLSLTAQEGLPGAAHTTVTAEFGNIGTLQPGDDVRENSVRIGRVAAARQEQGRAVVTLELEGSRTVHRDARASVQEQSALGQKFVDISPGSPGAGPLGDHAIPESRSADSADLDQALDTFDPRTRVSLQGAVGELGAGSAGRGQDLHDALAAAPELLAGTGQISDALASPKANLPGLLNSVDRLAGRFANNEQRLAALVDNGDRTMDAVAADDAAPLRESLRQLPATLRGAHGALTSLRGPLADTRSALTDVRSGAEELGRSTADLRGVLREAVPPMRQVPGVAALATPAVEELTHVSSDAQPLAPEVARGLSSAQEPLRALAPYSKEILDFFANARSALSDEVNGLHWLRIAPALSPTGIATPQPLNAPLVPHNAYPAPGQAPNDRMRTLGGGK